MHSKGKKEKDVEPFRLQDTDLMNVMHAKCSLSTNTAESQTHSSAVVICGAGETLQSVLQDSVYR